MKRALALSVAVILAGGLVACSEAPTEQSSNAHEHYPVTIDNCGQPVTFKEAPSRVVLLESAPVTELDGIGALDRVIARAGKFPSEYYDAALSNRIEEIPALSEDIDASGHLMMSQEIVVGQQPDLVLGLPSGVTREGLGDVGANVLIQNIYCDDHPTRASFDAVYDQLRDLGQVFDKQENAESLIQDLSSRVSAASEKTQGQPVRRAAILYPSTGGGPLYAYGSSSMATPQLEAAGFENVFSDVPERVFEVNTEDLIGRDPEVIIVLHQGDGDAVMNEVRNLPGAKAISAVKNNQLMPQLFNFTEPATPLSVVGLEQIVDHFYSQDDSNA